MNAMRGLAAGVVVCLLAGAAAADSKAENAKLIVGKWEVTKTEGGLPPGSTVEFTADGKVKITAKREGQEITIEGTYKVEGDKFSVTAKQGEDERTQTVMIKKISKSELVIENSQGKTSELKKK